MGTANADNNFTLPSYEDIFTSEVERSGAKPVEIPISMIDDFPGHPFHVRNDSTMQALKLSIQDLGQLSPAIVRKKDDGRYEMISGHRRKFACTELNIPTLICQVLDVSEDEATVLMVESNIYRENVSLSEKAFAYKMRFDAIKRMKEKFRTDNMIEGRGRDRVPEYIKGKSKDRAANDLGISRSQASRFIRFTYLNRDLLDLLDKGKLPQETATSLSYLDEDCMDQVVSEIEDNGASIPGKDICEQMKARAQDNNLTPDDVHALMCPNKVEKEEKFALRGTKVKALIPEKELQYNLEGYTMNAFELYRAFYESKSVDEYISKVKIIWNQLKIKSTETEE